MQKFDHHCVFVNNCLGYKNHRWFLLLLISFTMYMFILLIHSIYAMIVIGNLIYKSQSEPLSRLKIACDAYLIIVILLHSPIVYL